MTVTHDRLELSNLEARTRELCTFVRDVVDDAGADGVVVGLSGGIDSTVSAHLAVEALGSDNVYGLILPAEATSERNESDARHVAEELVIDHRVIEIQPVLDTLLATITREVRESSRRAGESVSRYVAVDPVDERANFRGATGNAAARLRMLVTYFEANTTNRLVLGTGNRSELLLGYFTKYGDGGVDCLPIGDLYKTQVRALARHLGVRDRIVEKPPTAGLWRGQTDQSELGAPYEVIDEILVRLVDEGRSVAATADALECDPELVRAVADRHERTAHKRRLPPTPATRSGGDDSSEPGRIE